MSILTSSPAVQRPAAMALALAALVGLAACTEQPEQSEPAKPVRVLQVRLAAPGGSDSYTGAVRARVESDLAFRVGGKIVRRHVEVGQQVRSGDAIAELDAQDYALAVSAAGNQQRAAAAEAEQAAADAARFDRLAAQGFVSAAEAQRHRTRADAARERLGQARQEVELARNRSAYTMLRAPFDGVITSLRAEPGQVVEDGQPVATMAKGGEREIIVDLPESRVVEARRSTNGHASLWSGDGTRFAVTLRELAPIASTVTRTYRARYRIGPDAPPMELGMTATVWLEGDSSASAAGASVATLPASALHHRDGQPAVWTVPASGTPTLVPVQVVRYAENEVQVSGLREGELVVTAGVQKLNAGLQVVAVNEDGKPVADASGPGGTLRTAAANRPWPTVSR